MLGIKSFFSEPEKVAARIRKMREKRPALPGKRLHRDFDIDVAHDRGYPVYTLTPKSGVKPGAAHILYLHGGGYIMDIASAHWGFVARLCKAMGASATVPLYPLAPESKAAKTLPKMQRLYQDLAAAHGAQNITVMGDSAGGGMTLALAQMLRDEGSPLPARLVLLSPWLDATGTHAMQPELEKRDRMLALAGLKQSGKMYAGDLPVTDPRVSPLFGELHGLPPIQMFAGTWDILLPDARRLKEKADADSNAPMTEYHEYKKMFHVWMLLPIREGKKAMRQIVEFMKNT